MIKRGASTIMVPGTSPDGCLASILTDYGSGNMEDYDLDTGYLIWMNELNEYNNQLLQQKLNTIRDRNSGVVIIYADFYNATMQLYRSPKDYGNKFILEIFLQLLCFLFAQLIQIQIEICFSLNQRT